MCIYGLLFTCSPYFIVAFKSIQRHFVAKFTAVITTSYFTVSTSESLAKYRPRVLSDLRTWAACDALADNMMQRSESLSAAGVTSPQGWFSKRTEWAAPLRGHGSVTQRTDATLAACKCECLRHPGWLCCGRGLRSSGARVRPIIAHWWVFSVAV